LSHRKLGTTANTKLSRIRNEIVDEYIAGKSTSQIAKDHNVSTAAILYQLDKADVPLRAKGWISKEAQTNRKTAPSGPESKNWLRLPDEEIAQEYLAGESIMSLAVKYKTGWSVIRKRLVLQGVTPRPAGFSKHHLMHDGCLVQSNLERIVHGWLIRHKLAHVTNPRVPWAVGSRQQRGDFRIGAVFIEVWGVANSPKYEWDRAAKTAEYRKRRIPLIELWPEQLVIRDFSVLEHWLPILKLSRQTESVIYLCSGT